MKNKNHKKDFLMADTAQSLTEQKDLAKYNEEVRQNKVKDYLSKAGHKLVSRRDFLAAGLTQFTAAITLPSIATVLTRANIANGAELNCPKPDPSSIAPGFLTINPTGGIGTKAVVVPLDKGSQLLPSYSLLSMGTTPQVEQAYGAVWNLGNPASNTFLNGLRNNGVADDGKVAVIGINCRTPSDTGNNASGPQGMLAKAIAGATLPHLGNRNSTTGGGFLSAKMDPPAPLVTRSFTDIRNAVQIQGSLANFSVKQKEALLKTVNRFNERQLASLSNANGATQLNTLLQCAGLQNIEVNGKGTAGIDPVSDARVAGIWGLAANSNVASEQYILGAMAYNSFNGVAGMSVFSRGGYDYHNNPIANTDAADVIIMDYAQRAVRTAVALAKPAMILIPSDGSVRSNNSATKSDWQGDRDDSLWIMILYSPNGVKLTRSQIGAHAVSQNVDLTIGPADNLSAIASVIAANYLKFAGKANMISSLTGLSPTDANIIVA